MKTRKVLSQLLKKSLAIEIKWRITIKNYKLEEENEYEES